MGRCQKMPLFQLVYYFLTFRRAGICVWFEDVSRVRDPKALEHSQASSVLNNNLVNHPPPLPPPLPAVSHLYFERVSRLRPAMSDFPSVSKHLVWEGSERPHVLTRSGECSGGSRGRVTRKRLKIVHIRRPRSHFSSGIPLWRPSATGAPFLGSAGAAAFTSHRR